MSATSRTAAAINSALQLDRLRRRRRIHQNLNWILVSNIVRPLQHALLGIYSQLPSSMLDKLLNAKYEDTRLLPRHALLIALAKNRNLTRAQLSALYKEAEETFNIFAITAISEQEHLPDELLITLAATKAHFLAVSLCSRTNLTNSQIEILLSSKDKKVYRLLARNPHIPEEYRAFAALADDRSQKS